MIDGSLVGDTDDHERGLCNSATARRPLSTGRVQQSQLYFKILTSETVPESLRQHFRLCNGVIAVKYRHSPFGIRARILDAECTNATTAEEIILRDDGGSGDLGYPWATIITPNRALVVYYFNKQDGTRHIAGSLLSLD